jgi:hypothetical protein
VDIERTLAVGDFSVEDLSVLAKGGAGYHQHYRRAPKERSTHSYPAFVFFTAAL